MTEPVSNQKPSPSTTSSNKTPSDTRTHTLIVVQPRIAAANSPPGAAPLVGTKPDFDQSLKTAERKLLEGKTVEARSLFQQISVQIQKTRLPDLSFEPVRCHLGLALSYPSGQERTQHASSAYLALIKIFNLVETSETKASPLYSVLRWHFKKLKPLMPFLKGIDDKIEICGKHIDTIDTFKELLEEADELRTKKDANCRTVYEKALAFIDQENGIEFQIARVKCLLRLTSTYKKESSDIGKFCDRTQKALFDLYDRRHSISQSGFCTEAEAFAALIDFLNLLLDLTSFTKNKEEIQNKINDCTKQLEALDKSKNSTETSSTPMQDLMAATILSGPNTQSSSTAPLPAPEQPNTSDKASRKVTRAAPDVYNKFEGIFISCIVIALVAIAGMALYQRNMVTVSK